MDTHLSSVLAAELATWPGRAAIAVVAPGGVVGRAGVDEAYRWASVTKVLTALTVVHAARTGMLDLDEPAGPKGSTLRILLAHASGLSMDEDRVLAPPGTRRIYSNRGIELAAELLEARAGQPFATVLSATVLDPLGMGGCHLEGSPAHGMVGPVGDLARLASELLAPRVLDPGLVAAVTSPTLPALGGVLPGFGGQRPNDWGLGIELRGHKHPHWTAPEASPTTFGHFGQSGAFLWVDPVAGVACVAAGAEPFGPWAAEAWPRLASRVLDAVAPSGIAGVAP
ncbi:serine hydrolase [Nocardioides psychrotolerans]|uniref:CubicO group peptidase, beta-lactamase class C family n=1 Tax=Nocardioides psychrotolerans TaxID=1005945 RepID=A0A1I3HKX6_9ACTN|nr:serine hydrolase domain-containing protein [Nocardioides psychrotolerans]GEP40015.1 serine hydrolase [Nocardioides psychrotolerans]SFI36386.1 CubicO group peptidase, beta-lactamase class C family [Nocardioides psychrotolerans]